MIGLWNLRRLRRSGIPLSAASYPALREALLPRDPRRPVTVCSSSAVRVPTAIGFFRPVILIPDWALRDLPADELRIILLHELAHIQRWDDWTNLAQKFVRSLFFFHPAVWWIEKRLSLEREMACDDAVLAETGDPRAYAECLVSLAEKSLFRRSLALAQAAISHAHETSVRLARILQADRNQSTAIFKPALAVITVFAGLSLCVIVKAPKLVAFQNSPSSTNVATASPTPGPGTQARVVPAMMRIHDNAAEKVAHAVPAVYRPVTQHPVKTVSSIAVAHGQHPQVLAVLARETTPAPAPAPAPAMFMVIQTTTFDDRGTPVWSVRVWRLTFIVPTPALATTAKST